jgi:AbrB family looped-hinge helix DNA binding protein
MARFEFELLKNKMKIVTGKNPNDAWRISLPKDACRHLGWGPGDTIEVAVQGEQILLRRAVPA